MSESFEKVEFTQKDIMEAIEEEKQKGNSDEVFYTREKLIIGLDFQNEESLESSIERASNLNFDFIMTKTMHEVNKEFQHNISTTHYLLKSELWCQSVIGRIEINSKKFPKERREIEKNFKTQVEWAKYLSLKGICISISQYDNIEFISQLLNQNISELSNTLVFIQVPLEFPEKKDSWEIWNKLRILCDYNLKLNVLLEMTENTPENDYTFKSKFSIKTKRFNKGWIAEPLHSIVLPTSIFTTGTEGNPKLSQKHVELLEYAFNYQIQIILSGKTKDINDYKEYIEIVYDEIPPLSEEEYFIQPYYDYLQQPLQPLMMNLENQTYDVFEKDPVKYDLYQDAFYHACKDMKKNEVTVYVLGSGRGGIVKRVLRAAKQLGQKMKLYAVEKNPNAIAILKHFKKVIWGDKVEIIEKDMRDLKDYSGTADIIVSELLGSFGDNELSPECIDGAQHLLKKTGISIPCEYTSFIALLHSSKFYSNVRKLGNVKYFETPYVNNIHQYQLLSKPQKLFKFNHPKKDEKEDNTRFKSIKFKVLENGMVHGIAGYFEAKLYKDIYLSINPETKDTYNKNMFSWFPITFPIVTPFKVKKNSTVQVTFSRNLDSTKVWYEWSVSDPVTLPIHNTNGRSNWVGL
eukprot:gene6228-10234_t